MIKNSKYLLIALPIFLASCLGKFVTSEADTIAAEEANTILSYAQTNSFKLDPSSGIYFKISKEVKVGEAASVASDFYIAYTLKTLAGVDIISKSSRDSVILNLYTANLFKGFVQSLFLLREGEKGQFVISSVSAYGQNPPTGIPKNAPLLVEIEILDLIGENEKIEKYILKKSLKLDTISNISAGLRIIRLNPANTNPAVKDGDNLSIKYTGRLLNDKEFDSGSFPLVLGSGGAIKGFEEGLKKLKKGEKAKLVFPSILGYGAKGSGNNIPPYTPLAFDVEILTVNGK
jgi:FKBP-type peptidyl-prolyl cis-trans isomerase